jgi:transposase
MRFITRLAPETEKLLKRIEQKSKYYQVRQRVKCIQLSYQGYQISSIMKILKVSRNTIYNWLNNWEKYNLIGLYSQKGRGRKNRLDEEKEEQVKQWIKKYPKNLKIVQSKIKNEWEIEISKETIKRIGKKKGMGWYRLRKRVRGKPEPKLYEQKKEELKELEKQEREGKIDLYYCDESGFSLVPYLPYAWQEKGQKIEVESSISKRLNVLGFLKKDNSLESYVFEGTINSEIIIACIDKLSENLEKETILVMDNASIHRSKKLEYKQKEWSKKGLKIFFLPTYSPQLNKIEILWRFIKYKWLEPSAYGSYLNLVKAVEDVLINFGSKYTINFV